MASGWTRLDNSQVAEESGPPDERSDHDPLTRSPPLGLPVAVVARRLGIAPATLRTWDRRYGVGPSAHTAGSHRRYTAEDLGRLEAMSRHISQGVPPADAARLALSDPSPAAPPGRTRAGGGRVLPLPRAEAEIRGLARAALALDGRACLRQVRSTLDARGVVPTWEELLVPVLLAIGERWQATGQGVESEHLLSESILAALRAVIASVGVADGAPVLLASSEDEQHTLPVHVLAAALAERGRPARVLGARVPVFALGAAVLRTGPPAIFLWSSLAHTGRWERFAALPAVRPAPRLVIGGPGWDLAGVPHSVTVVRSLPEAIAVLDTPGSLP